MQSSITWGVVEVYLGYFQVGNILPLKSLIEKTVEISSGNHCKNVLQIIPAGFFTQKLLIKLLYSRRKILLANEIAELMKKHGSSDITDAAHRLRHGLMVVGRDK